MKSYILYTETEKRKSLESKIQQHSDNFSTMKKAYDNGAELAGLAMGGSRQALQSLIDEYIENSGDINDVDLPEGFKYKQRFIGGYLGSNDMALVGEQGPEMLISDMPSYIKTINQIARNLGDAIKEDVRDDGTNSYEYANGYKLETGGFGQNLFDKDGKLLYNETPNLNGLTRRTYGEGDYIDYFEMQVDTGDGVVNVGKHMFNGKVIGTEIQSGTLRIAQAGGLPGDGQFFSARKKVSDQYAYGAEAMTTADGVSTGAAMIENNMPSLVKPEDFEEDKAMMAQAMDSFGASSGTDTSMMASLFKNALKNMTHNQRRQVVRSSSVYE